MIEVSPSSVTLQPGQITTINVKYIFPLNSTYLKSTIQISGTGSNNTNESIITITDFRINLGSNLFYTTTAYSSNYLSTYPTDQNDQLLIYFENITNIGEFNEKLRFVSSYMPISWVTVITYTNKIQYHRYVS